MSEEIKAVTAEDLVNQLSKGKKLHDDFATVFRTQYTIAEQSIEYWKDYFKVTLPPDLSPQTCKEVDSRLMDLHQEASFFKAEVEARLAAYKSANDDRYRTKFAELVTEYKASQRRLPSKDTLAALAENHIGDIKNALVHAQIELIFWKEILSDLNNARKLVENATINLSVEAKALTHERYIDSLNTKR